jgi:signal transduction histidine kinase
MKLKPLCILLMFVTYVSLAQEAIVIDKKITVQSISQSVAIFKDSTTKLSFEAIRQQYFQPYSVSFLQNSSPSDILWIKFKIVNQQADSLKLILSCGKQFFLDLYQINEKVAVKHTTGGTFVAWDNLIDGYGLPIILAPKQSSEIYFRVGTDAFYTKNLLLEAKLFDETVYAQNLKDIFWSKRYLAMLYVFTIGFLACSIVVAIFQYYTFPDKAILYYLGVISMSEMMVIRVAEYHLDLRIISFFFPSFFVYVYVIQTMLGLAYFIFIGAMFNLKSLQPNTHKLVKKGIIVHLLLIMIGLVSTWAILDNRSVIGSSYKITGFLTVLSVAFVVFIIYLSSRQINTYNRYVIYGFAFMAIGYGTSFYLNRIQIGEASYANYFLKIPSVYICLGTILEFVFFMIALSKRSRLLEKEALTKGQTLERKRVASELHDNVNSLLASVKVGLQSIQPSENQSRIYENVVRMVDNATREVRQISHNMVPYELEKEGLSHALLSLVMRLNLSGSTYFELDLTALKQRLSNEVEFNLYMICLELCQNIIKHAEASKAKIEFEMITSSKEKSQQLVLFVWDNGKGFEKEKIVEGMGLKNIRHRAKSIGADLQVQSHDDGTTFYLKIPVTQPSHV